MIETVTTPTPPAACPLCGYKVDAASPSPFEADQTITPRPGDLTICLKCTEPLVFDDELRPRTMTDGEWLELPTPTRESITRLRSIAKQIPWPK